jgi:hypothetical protein
LFTGFALPLPPIVTVIFLLTNHLKEILKYKMQKVPQKRGIVEVP